MDATLLAVCVYYVCLLLTCSQLAIISCVIIMYRILLKNFKKKFVMSFFLIECTMANKILKP